MRFTFLFLSLFTTAFCAPSLEEKVSELFVLPLVPSRVELVAEAARTHALAGVIVQPGQTAEVQEVLRKAHAASKVPLLVLVDAERGIGMRCRDFPNLPRALTLAASGCDLEAIGQEVGQQCRALGAQICLGPVVDCLHHPRNAIGLRGFGNNPDRIAQDAAAFCRGMKRAGVMTCAKHFPGHGGISADSHTELPTIETLTEKDLAPFRHLIHEGVDAVMPGHLAVPSHEKRPFFSATLSKALTHDLLKKEMQFRGIVISDALNMMALRNHFTPEEVALNAFEAGVDIFLFGGYPKGGIDLALFDEEQKKEVERIVREDFPRMKKALVTAFQEGRLKEEELDRRLEKIHALKAQKLASSDLSLAELKTRTQSLRKELFSRAITLVKDPKGRLPVKNKKIHLIHAGNPELGSLFGKLLDAQESKEGAQIVLAQFGVDPAKPDFGISKEFSTYKGAIFVLFDNPYALQGLCPCITQIVAYEPEKEAVEAAAAFIQGTIQAQGRLPIGN